MRACPSRGVKRAASPVTIDAVRDVARGLPRAYEVVVRGRLKFRVGRIVWLAFSRDETEMGFAFPKEWREALVEAQPEKFRMPGPADLKYNWAVVRLSALDRDEMRDLVVDAWSMVVPRSVVDDYLRESDSPG
jgi:hypothetical protein